jgi:hypothetical protein
MNPLFPPNSRYVDVGTSTFQTADGREVVHLARRLVPPSSRFSQLTAHPVAEGDRLDNLAARHLGDPLLYWRLCDANDALRPRDLLADVGRRLRITLPEGIPGGADVDG